MQKLFKAKTNGENGFGNLFQNRTFFLLLLSVRGDMRRWILFNLFLEYCYLARLSNNTYNWKEHCQCCSTMLQIDRYSHQSNIYTVM